MTLLELRDRLRVFDDDRDWGRFHTPRNLVLALGGEVGELMELFQGRDDAEIEAFARTADGAKALGDELTDVLLYLVRLADVLSIPLDEAVESKWTANELRYDPDRVRGSAAKQPPA